MKNKLSRCKPMCVDSYREKLIKLQMTLLIQNHNNQIEADKKCQVEEIWKIKENQYSRATHMLKNLLKCQIILMRLQEQQNRNLDLSCLIRLIVPDLLKLLKEVLMSLIMELSITVNGPRKV